MFVNFLKICVDQFFIMGQTRWTHSLHVGGLSLADSFRGISPKLALPVDSSRGKAEYHYSRNGWGAEAAAHLMTTITWIKWV